MDTFDIKLEIAKVEALINNKIEYIPNNKICFIMYCIQQTRKYKIMETYVQKLLCKVDIREITHYYQQYNSACDILHIMVPLINQISLDMFKIIIKNGGNVNGVDYKLETPLLSLDLTRIHNFKDVEHIISVIELFVKHGANLNAEQNGKTLLDLFAESLTSLTDENKRIIMGFIDCGANIKCTDQIDLPVLNFIEAYICNRIKSATKNE